MFSIAVDAGNTNVKMAVFADNALVETITVVTKDAARALKRLLDKHEPTHSILSNVGAPLRELHASMKARTDFMLMDSKTPVPLRIHYKSSTLGTDRLALATLAHHLFPNRNALVVSVGTCITYDVVDASGAYRGGAISPGLRMRLRAMHEFTARLPNVKLTAAVDPIGQTTQASMLSGAVVGAANEANGYADRLKETIGKLNVVLTGGDAAYLEAHLKFKIFARPYAVLEGLQRILQHNLGAH
jgi:type III pantothenate kinase